MNLVQIPSAYGIRNEQGYWTYIYKDKETADKIAAKGMHKEKVIPLYELRVNETPMTDKSTPRTDAFEQQWDRMQSDRFILKAPQRDDLPNPWAVARLFESELADCKAELAEAKEEIRLQEQVLADRLASHAEREAKWCSYCGVNTHNDAECWSTRPADWSKERYPDAFKFPPTIIDTSSVGGVAPSPAGPDALAEELERVKARYEALLANFRGRCLYCSSCDHIQDCMANLGCLNVPIACGMSKIEADAALSRKRGRKHG